MFPLSGLVELHADVEGPAATGIITTGAHGLATHRPEPGNCRRADERYTWDAVAEQLDQAYAPYLERDRGYFPSHARMRANRTTDGEDSLCAALSPLSVGQV